MAEDAQIARSSRQGSVGNLMAASLSIKLGRVSSTGTPHGLQDQQSSSQSVTAASHSPFCTERRRRKCLPFLHAITRDVDRTLRNEL